MADKDLTFNTLRDVNTSRKDRWHSGADGWTGADWSNAMCGEAGEAANVVKKLRRHETGIRGGPGMVECTCPTLDPSEPRYVGHVAGCPAKPYNTPGADDLLAALADELADVVLYADLLGQFYGIDLAAAVVAKFNRVSEAQGFPERLP